MRIAEYSWHVPLEHPAFAGHFPGRPIVPGVVLLDQAILFAEKEQGVAPVCWQVGNAKFFSPVAPGETLIFTLQIKPQGSISFNVRSAGRDIASGTLLPAAE